MLKRRAARIVRLLAKLYPDAKCALNHDNALQLLIATILSAQCTDVRVNIVTPALFARYPNARAFAEADRGELETVPGITVDTHVLRLSHRMGLTKQTDAHKVEQDLNALIPKKEWTMFSHRMIFHGRQVCFARKPNCPGCILAEVCPKIGVKL